jgi:hypothetical protein
MMKIRDFIARGAARCDNGVFNKFSGAFTFLVTFRTSRLPVNLDVADALRR